MPTTTASTISCRRSPADQRSVDTSTAISPFGPPQFTPTAAFEHAFRVRLAVLGGHDPSPTVGPRRCVVTALVVALRSGNSADRVLSLAQGISATELAAAYDHIERLRRRASDSLDLLFEDPTVGRFQALADSIEPLLPRVVTELSKTAVDDSDVFPAAVRRVRDRSEELARKADEIDALLGSADPSARSALARLDDGQCGGLRHHPVYRARRVGDLTPHRLSLLLGETIGEARR